MQNLAGYRDTAFRMRNENCFGGNINVPSSDKCLSEALSIFMNTIERTDLYLKVVS